MNKNIIYSIISGTLLGAPFCIPQLSFLIFFAWIPLLWIEDKTRNHNNTYLLFNYAFVSFLIWNFLAYWWVSKAQLLGVIFIIIINSMLLALVFWLISKSRQVLKISILFPFLIIWLGFEYFHTQWDLAWPWLNLGNSFASETQWIQWYEFTGTRGGSMWIILINFSLFKIIRHTKNIPYKQIIFLLILIVIPLYYSSILMDIEENTIGEKTFACIQPNLDPYNEKFIPENELKHFENFISTADSICSKLNPDFLFGPETLILQSIKEETPESSYFYRQIVKLKHKYPKTNILIGVHSNKENESYNSAIFLSDTFPQFYHKTKLVPLFERMPFNKYLHFLKKYSLEIGGYHGTYSNKNDLNYFLSDTSALVPIVCFESVFGDYCAQRVPDQSGFICMITNDGWWKNTPGYRYHFNFSRIRAIESRRHYIRAANNGISAHINSKGTIITQTKWWTKTILTGKISLLNGNTFFSLHGDYIGRVCMFFGILLLMFVKIRTYTSRL